MAHSFGAKWVQEVGEGRRIGQAVRRNVRASRSPPRMPRTLAGWGESSSITSRQLVIASSWPVTPLGVFSQVLRKLLVRLLVFQPSDFGLISRGGLLARPPEDYSRFIFPPLIGF